MTLTDLGAAEKKRVMTQGVLSGGGLLVLTKRKFDGDWPFGRGRLTESDAVFSGHAKHVVAALVQPGDTERQRTGVNVPGTDVRSAAARHALLHLVA